MSEPAFGGFPLASKSQGKRAKALSGQMLSTGSQAGHHQDLLEAVPSFTGEAAFSQGSRHL